MQRGYRAWIIDDHSDITVGVGVADRVVSRGEIRVEVEVQRVAGQGHALDRLEHAATRVALVDRDDGDAVTDKVASSALKWHGYLGVGEFEVIGAKHYDEPVFGLSVRLPLGQALVRADMVGSRDTSGQRVYSGLVNADVSFTLGQRNVYVFGEYFHNGWGVKSLPDNPRGLPQELLDRLNRGEVFNLMQDYLALGGSYEWHPLLTQTATLITNLHDSSSLLQMQFSFQPGDNQSMDLGWILPLGAAGDEFGGIPLAGPAVTSGGASRGYFRWVYFL